MREMLLNAGSVILAGICVALFTGMAGTWISVNNLKRDVSAIDERCEIEIAVIKNNQKSFNMQLSRQKERQLVLETRFIAALEDIQQHESSRQSMVNKVNR